MSPPVDSEEGPSDTGQRMPITTRYLRDHDLYVTTWIGGIDPSEVGVVFGQVSAHPWWRPELDHIADLRRADFSRITPQDLKRLRIEVSGQRGEAPHRFRTAVIAPGDLTFGISRMYGLDEPDSPEEVRVFRTAEEAVSWLGVPSSVLQTGE